MTANWELVDLEDSCRFEYVVVAEFGPVKKTEAASNQFSKTDAESKTFKVFFEKSIAVAYDIVR